MAYQFSALFIEGTHVDAQDVFGEIGFPDGVHTGIASFVEATNPTPGTRYLAVADGWTMLTDAGNFVSVRSTAPFGALWSPQVIKFMCDATQTSRGFGFIMSSVSNTFGFSTFENGEMPRAFLHTMEMVVVDTGDEIPEEVEAMKLDDKQSAILLLMEKLGVPFRTFETADFQAIAFETQRLA